MQVRWQLTSILGSSLDHTAQPNYNNALNIKKCLIYSVINIG